MSGGTKIFLAVFGLLLILLIVYYGFLGGVGPDQVKADGEITDPLTAASDQANQPKLAQHENRPLFSKPGGGDESGSTSVPFGGGDRTNPFGLASPNGESSNGVMFQSQAPGNSNRSVRDPLLPTPQAVNDPLSVSTDSNRPLVQPHQPHQPRRPQTTFPGSSTGGTLTGTADVTAPRSNAAESVHYFIYTVKANDTLSGIALDWFKDSTKWDLIVEANPGINPDFIRQGDRLRIPPKSAARTTAAGNRATSPMVATGPRTHTIRSGDTLSDIAQQYYGSQNRWRDIYNANRKVIGSDPDTLHAGDRLTIPD